MKSRATYCSLLLAAILPVSAPGRDWFVNPETGQDTNSGENATPLATAQEAVEQAEDGDRIILLPQGALYRQSIDLRKAPHGLVILGNGVTLTGADPLTGTEWESLGDDLFRTRLPHTAMNRHLLIVGGKAVRMGRMANRELPFPAAEELKPGEFRWDGIDESSGWLTVKGSTEKLEWSIRTNGLATSGTIRNIKVFDLNTRHFLNDGFNIHGDARGLQFFGISGHENFDEGFSAHDTSECWIRGGSFYRNEHGVADVNSANTYYEDSTFGDNIACDVLFQGGRHSLTNCRIETAAGVTPLSIVASKAKDTGEEIAAHLIMRGVVFTAPDSAPGPVRFGAGSHVYYDESTTVFPGGIDIAPTAIVGRNLYETYPIGRTEHGVPIMAWSGGATRVHPSTAYRIVHFGKFSPGEIAGEFSPDNDWLGITTPVPLAAYPPEGKAFQGADSAAHAVWRWIGQTAPDAVFVPDSPEGRALAKGLQQHAPGEVGMVKVFLVRDDESQSVTTEPLSVLRSELPLAKDEMLARLSRSPEEVIRELSRHYGNKFSGSYIEALALMTKVDLDIENRAEELAKTHAETAALPKGAGDIAGTILYTRFDTDWARERLLAVADLAFDGEGKPLEAMPSHNEMSDAVFMSCPLLVYAGKISGEKRYFDQCVRHLKFMQQLCLREDDIYRHSPLDDAAWGRGNGFPALGLALTLEVFPEDHPDRAFLLDSFRSHLAALARHQDSHGMWHQVIDRPDSYAEFTSTCMIAYAVAVGMDNGWLEEAEWKPRVFLAWEAIKSRIGTDGQTLTNVCTGTGKQKTLEDYYQREAILGKDDRGGAMALLLASAMRNWYNSAKAP